MKNNIYFRKNTSNDAFNLSFYNNSDLIDEPIKESSDLSSELVQSSEESSDFDETSELVHISEDDSEIVSKIYTTMPQHWIEPFNSIQFRRSDTFFLTPVNQDLKDSQISDDSSDFDEMFENFDSSDFDEICSRLENSYFDETSELVQSSEETSEIVSKIYTTMPQHWIEPFNSIQFRRPHKLFTFNEPIKESSDLSSELVQSSEESSDFDETSELVHISEDDSEIVSKIYTTMPQHWIEPFNSIQFRRSDTFFLTPVNQDLKDSQISDDSSDFDEMFENFDSSDFDEICSRLENSYFDETSELVQSSEETSEIVSKIYTTMPQHWVEYPYIRPPRDTASITSHTSLESPINSLSLIILFLFCSLTVLFRKM